MSKQLLVFGEGKHFKVTVPDGAKVTFGPWSPPTGESKYGSNNRALSGTLRIYEGSKSTENIIAVFSGVEGFRDLSLGYAEQVAREEGAVIWKDDEHGYVREDKVSRQHTWVVPTIPKLGEGDAEDETAEED